ncbi:DUF2272 domain-containing protein [Pelomonas sp. APW6]|uniref:DUF2272 domain-containing protein n=1 Tax=Roseateles subflavus TaxID=3053353 RepID=A0ABT7LS09_9BURK|nr:DUF2272 domain-containing protein [Pelomonas sp. APW6]MDL5034256.1 DUF2272 domain-containing protein [Pelomonas sp. APW6]
MHAGALPPRPCRAPVADSARRAAGTRLCNATRARAGAIAAALALLGGCTTLAPPPAPPVRVEPTLPDVETIERSEGDGAGGHPVSLPDWNERITQLAQQEWTLWGQVRWKLQTDELERPRGLASPTEAEPAFTSRVLHYWFAIGAAETQQRLVYPDGSMLPWSAAFISYLARTAGLSAQQFPPSAAHWSYIRASLEQPRRSSFEALDAALARPQPGDLICAPREAAVQRLGSFAQLQRLTRQERERSWPFHCDLVVEVAPDKVGAIGGNVHERVVWTEAAIDGEGHLLMHPERPWIVVLRRTLDPAGIAPSRPRPRP